MALRIGAVAARSEYLVASTVIVADKNAAEYLVERELDNPAWRVTSTRGFDARP